MDGALKFVNYKVGATQNPYSFIESIFFSLWKYFLMNKDPKGMTQFDRFHTFDKGPL